MHAVFIYRPPGQKPPLLDLQVDNSVIFHKSQTCYNPKITQVSVKFFKQFLRSLHVVLYVGDRGPQIDVSVRVLALFVAETHAVGAVPEQPTPPAVDFRGAARAALFSAQNSAVFVLDVLVTTTGLRVLILDI